MKLLLNKETERELAAGLPSANDTGVTDAILEEVGAWMTDQAVNAIDRAGFAFTRAYHQSVGACVIVQSASDAERCAWDSGIARCRETAAKMLARLAAYEAALE